MTMTEVTLSAGGMPDAFFRVFTKKRASQVRVLSGSLEPPSCPGAHKDVTQGFKSRHSARATLIMTWTVMIAHLIYHLWFQFQLLNQFKGT